MPPAPDSALSAESQTSAASTDPAESPEVSTLDTPPSSAATSKKVRMRPAAAAAATADVTRKLTRHAKAKAKVVKTTMKEDAKTVGRDVLRGQDGLGAIVKVAAKKHSKLDCALHFCNGVGFQWADRHRIPILIIVFVLAVASFGTTLCGVLGMGSFAIDTMPWGEYSIVNLSYVLENCSLTTQHLQSFPGPSMCPNSFLNLTYATQASARWKFSPWGICFLSSDTTINSFIRSMVQQRNPRQQIIGGASCQPWGSFSSVFIGLTNEFQCARPTSDDILLIMSAFGAFVRMIDPFLRMRRSTDGHQKTALMIIFFATAIPPLVILIQYALQCADNLRASSEAFYIRGDQFKLSTGWILFLLGTLLIVPIGILHLIIPSPITTAMEAQSTMEMNSIEEEAIVTETSNDASMATTSALAAIEADSEPPVAGVADADEAAVGTDTCVSASHSDAASESPVAPSSTMDHV